MVMVKLKGDIVNLDGKVGGDVWRTDVCGQHIQKLPRVVAQREELPQQTAFTMAKNAWSRHQWTKAEIDSWWVWCSNHPKHNKKGETRYFHPFLAFLSVNIKRLLDGEEIIYIPTG